MPDNFSDTARQASLAIYEIASGEKTPAMARLISAIQNDLDSNEVFSAFSQNLAVMAAAVFHVHGKELGPQNISLKGFSNFLGQRALTFRIHEPTLPALNTDGVLLANGKGYTSDDMNIDFKYLPHLRPYVDFGSIAAWTHWINNPDLRGVEPPASLVAGASPAQYIYIPAQEERRLKENPERAEMQTDWSNTAIGPRLHINGLNLQNPSRGPEEMMLKLLYNYVSGMTADQSRKLFDTFVSMKTERQPPVDITPDPAPTAAPDEGAASPDKPGDGRSPLGRLLDVKI
ncbi:MAG TPA: hypothetical protein VHB73_05250 [Alphaproteobacteria bacterium]|nr:hypothetical protein [Alphaproteobacteria bacterium]